MSTVLIEKSGGLTVLTLNRPDQLNAFNDEQHLALRAGLEEAQNEETCRAILLTGSGRGFCAGQDLGDRNPDTMDGPPDLGHTLQTFYNPLIRLIREIPKPVVCAVNGVAAGAGANIAFACDIVLAAKSAKFIEAFSKIGLVPDSAGTWTLPRLVGEARAKAMIFTAEPVLAEEAERIGLIYKCVDDDQLLNEAKALAQKFASRSDLWIWPDEKGPACFGRKYAGGSSSTLSGIYSAKPGAAMITLKVFVLSCKNALRSLRANDDT